MHVRAEGHGKPVSFALSGGERHDCVALPALLDSGAATAHVDGPGCGRGVWRATKPFRDVRRGGICVGGTLGL